MRLISGKSGKAERYVQTFGGMWGQINFVAVNCLRDSGKYENKDSNAWKIISFVLSDKRTMGNFLRVLRSRSMSSEAANNPRRSCDN